MLGFYITFPSLPGGLSGCRAPCLLPAACTYPITTHPGMASSLLITPAGGSGVPGCGESAPRLGNVGSLSTGAVGSPWPPEPPRQEGGCFVLLRKPVQGWSRADPQGHPHQVVLRGAVPHQPQSGCRAHSATPGGGRVEADAACPGPSATGPVA